MTIEQSSSHMFSWWWFAGNVRATFGKGRQTVVSITIGKMSSFSSKNSTVKAGGLYLCCTLLLVFSTCTIIV